jgi:zinc protease
VPSARSAAPGESEALEVATHILGASQTSRLYRSLVVEKKIAVTAGGYYMSGALDDSRLWIYAMPAAGVSLEELDAAVGAELAAFKSAPPSARELARAKTRLIADAVYAQDSQTSLARWYGAALATGETVEEVAGWSARIDAVTAEQACEVARKYLTDKRSVTGFLKPEPQTEAA